jgi:hypothetical protein
VIDPNQSRSSGRFRSEIKQNAAGVWVPGGKLCRNPSSKDALPRI